MKELIYLACPYRHEDPLIQKKRCAAASFVAKELLSKGQKVFSPLTHNDLFARLHPEISSEMWMQFDLKILGFCNKLLVLKLPGWEMSKGVKREIVFAKENNITIEEMSPPTEKQIATMINPDLTFLLSKMNAIYDARDWDQFHSPKNWAIDLASEVGEILDHFKWITEEESRNLPPEILSKVGEEIGDALRSLISLAAKLGVDPVHAAEVKLPILERKYPVEKSKGKNLKYTAYTV